MHCPPNTAQAEIHVQEGGRVTVVLRGALDAQSMGGLWRELEARLAPLSLRALEVDARALHLAGAGGLALLRYLKVGGFTPQASVTVRGLSDDLDQILRLIADENLEALQAGRPRTPSLPEEIGAATRDFLGDLREQVAFLGAMAAELAGAIVHPGRLRGKEVKRLVITAGVNALPIVSLLSLLIGLMVGFESAGPLSQFGAEILIANMVGFGSIRELGPMMTAIMLAGRSGAAFAAELGTMKVNEELAALTTMGLDPLRFLALQRVAAGTILTPLLTVFTMFAGMVGGSLVMLPLGFSISEIYHQMATQVGLPDIAFGLGKSVVFGAIFSAVGCMRGFQTGLGPISVGVSATRAVVTSILLIILADTVFAAVHYLLGG